MPISGEEIQSLIERRESGGHILSVYLDVDQSRAANLNRGFQAALKERLRALEQQLDGQRQEFSADAGRVLEFVSRYVPRGRALVMFCDASRDFFWNRDLHFSVRSHARWQETPDVRPLLEALDEYERYSVALASKEELRLFTVYLGEIEEHRDFAAAKIKRTRSVAKDNRLSADNLQHKEEDQIHRNLKNFAETLEHFVAERRSGRLVLAGPREATGEIQKLLSKRLQAMVVSTIALPTEASDKDVLGTTLKIEEAVERTTEAEAVEGLITAASKRSQAVLELPATLEALHEGRIRKLLYAEDLALRGARCMNCDSLIVSNPAVCPYCGGSVQPVEDIVEHVAERVVDSGGAAEYVRAQAAERLRAAGGIGALLRY